ncbi:nucleotide pyrophosphohydrolase [Bifidobacterium tissieri]|uniref:Nucleotide pyrophosphohydrolase n=2 Tax=Bifidobacterium TaxID=1678 RepID=A0A261FFJ6_9BIFI|nr:nucleotide pyrophosphohydrolase [Bifidobacterium tissieri]TPF97307.1 nucleotide pyrophosphohydrolase [Bifidobacterium sp. UTCIF-39]
MAESNTNNPNMGETANNGQSTQNIQGNRGKYHLPAGYEHCAKLRPVAEAATALDRVKAIVDILYSPGGCPWDGKQTNRSLLKHLLEETYEYIDAVETNDRDNMREELGDVLLQSVFQARVCETDAKDPFDIDEVADRLVAKLITRHPHVFVPDDGNDDDDDVANVSNADTSVTGERAPETPEETLALWERVKQREKHRKSVLDGISHTQGAFLRAAKVVSRVSKSPDADELFKAFEHEECMLPAASAVSGTETTPRDGASDDVRYADEILDVIRRAQSAGVDVESALRNRLRMVEAEIGKREDVLRSSRS